MARPAVGETRFSRRNFIGTATAAGVALALPQLRCGGTSGTGSVVVIGAGLAGLVAAEELSGEGFDVTVVEARDRIGGRVNTIRSPFIEGQVAEGGAEYIDGVHSEMLGLVDRFGLDLDDLRELGDEPAVLLVDGEREVIDDLPAGVEEEFDGFFGEAAELAEDIDPEDLGEEAAELDGISVGDALDDFDPSPDARFAIERQIRDDYAIEADRLSALQVVLGEKSYEDASDDDVGAYRIRGGNDQLPRALADELDVPVTLSAPVTSVSQDSSGVRVQAGGEVVDADYAVLAVPLSVLGAVEFSPEPGAAPAAAAEVQYGAATKSLLQFTDRPWAAQSLGGDSISDLPSGSTWDATNAQQGAAGILVAYLSGIPATASADVGEPARIEAALAGVNRAFPGSRRTFSRGASVAWAGEPYSRGSWAAPAPGEVLPLREGTGRPIGRIHLAGEHTATRFSGYMEGAVRSGQRAAREIMERT